MKPNEETMLKALVAIAWADGRFADEESEILGALIDVLKIDAAGEELIRLHAKTPRTLDDVPVAELSADDREKLFRHAVILSHIDGGQDRAETSLLAAVAAKLGIGDDEARALTARAEADAKDLLDF